MSDLIVGAIKLGFLAALWLFIFAAMMTIKTDLFGQRAPAPSKPQKRFGRRPTPTKLRVLSGSQTNVVLPIDGEVRIGRNPDSHLVLDDDYISGNHARLFTNNRDAVILDLGSTNGTFVNEERISVPTPVTESDVIRVGRTQMQVEA